MELSRPAWDMTKTHIVRYDFYDYFTTRRLIKVETIVRRRHRQANITS